MPLLVSLMHTIDAESGTRSAVTLSSIAHRRLRDSNLAVLSLCLASQRGPELLSPDCNELRRIHQAAQV